MSLNDLVNDSDGFRIGVCLATIGAVGYFMVADLKEKDYRVLPFKEGVENTREMFCKDTVKRVYNVNARIERGEVYK